MILDFRNTQNDKETVMINDTSVSLVPSYKYLGGIIQDDIEWNEHITAQVKKWTKRMYFVRNLRKLKIDNKIIGLFYKGGGY